MHNRLLTAENPGHVVVILDDYKAVTRYGQVADRLRKVVFHVEMVELQACEQPDQLSKDALRRRLASLLKALTASIGLAPMILPGRFFN